MKICFKCGRGLPLGEFYPHPRMADGRLNKCRDCTRRDVQANREARAEKYRAHDQARNRSPERAATLRRSKERHPMHEWARRATHSAIAKGILDRRPCEVCGDAKSEAHHEDYTQPLVVRFFCHKHRMAEHRVES